MESINYVDVFKLYNFIATIFRSITDETDRASNKVANRLQDNSVISAHEEKAIRDFLDKGTKSITKPYTTTIGNSVCRIYLIEEKKLKESFNSGTGGVYGLPLRRVFFDIESTNIIIVNKDKFKMEGMYDNIDDKKAAIHFYSELFYVAMSALVDSKDYQWYYSKFADFLGLLFFYQATGGKISKKEFNDTYSSRYLGMLNLIEDILRIGEMQEIAVPLINSNPDIQVAIARKIEEEFSWDFYNSFKRGW